MTEMLSQVLVPPLSPALFAPSGHPSRITGGGYPYTNSLATGWAARNLFKPNYAQGELINSFYAALEAAGALTIGDAAYLLGAPHHEQAATINILQARFDASLVNEPGWVANRGISGDAASAYLDTLLNPSTSGTLKHLQNDCGLIYCVLTSVANVPASVAAADIGNGNFRVGRASGDKSVPMRAHSTGTDTAFNNAQGAEPAIFGISRESSSVLKTYKRGLGLVNTFATGSAAPNSETFRIGQAASAGFGINQMFFVMFTKSFTLQQFTDHADAIYNYAHNAAVGAM